MCFADETEVESDLADAANIGPVEQLRPRGFEPPAPDEPRYAAAVLEQVVKGGP